MYSEVIKEVKYLSLVLKIHLVIFIINEIQFLFTINIKHPNVIKYAICNIFTLIVIPNIYPLVPQKVLIYLIPYIKINNSDQTAQTANKAISIALNTSFATIT